MKLVRGIQIIRYKLKRKIYYKNIREQNNILHDSTYIGDGAILRDTKWGRHSGCGLNCEIYGTHIGNFTSIASGVKIGLRNHIYTNFMTHDFCYGRGEEVMPLPANINGFRDGYFVEIGDDVWIGANTIIQRNINVGTGAVIGAGSVVTKSIPPYAIVAGNPAKFIKWRFPNEIIQKLLEIRWWELSDEEIINMAPELSNLVGFDLLSYKNKVYIKKGILSL